VQGDGAASRPATTRAQQRGASGRIGEESGAQVPHPPIRFDLQIPAVVARLFADDPRWLNHAHAGGPRSIEQQPVKSPAVDQEPLGIGIVAELVALVPVHAHRPHRRESGRRDRPGGTDGGEHGEHARAQRLAEMTPRKGRSLDEADLIPELPEPDREHAAGRASPMMQISATDSMESHLAMAGAGPVASGPTASRARGREPEIGPEAIVQPAADVVAGRAAACDDLVMTASATQITRPALAAGLLPVDMAVGEPRRTLRAVDAVLEIAHRALVVTDEAVAGGEVAVRRDAEVARAPRRTDRDGGSPFRSPASR